MSTTLKDDDAHILGCTTMLLSFRGPSLFQEKALTKRRAPANKKWHPKVRSGCARCKIRRVKCDEETPECLRCRKAGFKCGYDVLKAKIFSIDDGLQFDKPGDKRFYDFFINEGSSLLTTFQPASIPFWLKMAPQLSRVCPAVQHGMTALGAIQAPLHYGTPGVIVETRRPEMSSTALSYLIKSMGYLAQADPNSISPEVSLTCCLCFMAMAIWTEKVSAPVIHIDAGLRMLRDYKKSVKKDPLRRSAPIEDSFVRPFNRLVINALSFSDGYPTSISGIPANHALDMDLDSVDYLLNFPDAFDSINTILKCIFRINEGHRTEGIKTKIDSALSQFPKSLEELHKRDIKTSIERGHPENANVDDLLHLKIHHRTAHIMFHARKAENETDFDLFQEDFAYILDQSQEYLFRAQEQGAGHAGNLRTLLGVIPPLFFTATKCRDSATRHLALELLHASLQTERGWTSCMATSLARFVIETEEDGLGLVPAELVPLERRIYLDQVDHSSADSLTYLQYRHYVYDELTPNRRASLPFRRHLFVETDGVTNPMSKKALHACGYTGVVLFTPRISCHCASPFEGSPRAVSDGPIDYLKG